jgi:hypothetical protein
MSPTLPIACLVALLLPGAAANASSLPSAETARVSARDGAGDFDFLPGHWVVHNRRLAKRLASSHDWITFDAEDDIAALPGGLGNEEHYRTDFWKGYQAVGLNLYQAQAHRWALYWMDNRNTPGVLQPPVLGTFEHGTGTFLGEDTFDGKAIRVRHRWTHSDRDHVHWEQAFSADGGASWETNWTMDFVRH